MTVYLIIYPEKIGDNIEKIQKYLSDKDYSKIFVIGNEEFKELGKKPGPEMYDLIHKDKRVEIMGCGTRENIGKVLGNHPHIPKIIIIKYKMAKEKKEVKKSRIQTAKEKAKAQAVKLKKEVKKAMSAAILAAFGFLMALVWRDVITEWVNKISEQSPVQGKLISALIVTLICVLGILIFTRLLREKEEEKK